MALTRKFLAGLGLEDNAIQAIIEAHTETTDALKEQRDQYKADAEELPGLKKKLKAYEDKEGEPDEWQKKYEDEHSAFEAYKADQKEKETTAAKDKAYRELLKAAGVSEKRIDTIMKVTPLKELELDKEGKFKNADELKKSITENWADFIATKETKGAETKTPPEAGSGSTMTKKDILAIKDTSERQKAMAENRELFGL